MSEFRTIEIDFDIHKLIEQERRSFAEEPREVLRRLLKLGEAPAATTLAAQRGWSGLGVTLPHGTKLRMAYNGVTYEGEIVEGIWVVAGQQFTSPSGAASGVAVTKKGKKTRLDGWNYWHVKLPGTSTWTTLFGLWESAEAMKKSHASR